MTISQLLTLPVTITRRTPAGGLDAYGNELLAETTVQTVGELQQRVRREPGPMGEMTVTDWLLVLPAGTVLDTGDAVDAGGDRYEVVGGPWPVRDPRTAVEHHVEATLRRTVGAEDAS